MNPFVVELYTLPVLSVEVLTLEGSTFIHGSTVAVEIRIYDLNGDVYDPETPPQVEVFRIDDTDESVEETAVISGSASQMTLGDEVRPGFYEFFVNTAALAADPNPTRALVKASVAYKNTGFVLQTTTIRLKEVTDIS